MGSDAGATWQGDVPPPTEPPPTPFERGAAPAVGSDAAPDAAPDVAPGATPAAGAPAVAGPRRRRRALLAVVAAVVLVGAGALVLAGRSATAPGGVDPADDAALLELLAAVDASELGMLAFDAAAEAAFEDATSEDQLRALVSTAAADAVAELRRGRVGLEGPLDVVAAEAVRAAYLPHLDAWIAYLAAVAEDPGILFDPAQEALILRINATAGVFSAALEEAVTAGVGPEVEAAARAILDRGFPDQDDADL